MKSTLRLTAAAIAALAVKASAEITTGWQSPLNGTYTWSDTNNWVDGEINGVFSPDLEGSGKTWTTILFTDDVTLPNGLELLYKNSEQNLTFRGDGTDHTLTLGGPLIMNLLSATKGSVIFGSKTAGQGLSLHFTSAPVFQIDNGPWPEVYQPIGGVGEALVTGSRDNARIFVLHGDAATFPGAVSVSPNKGLSFNSKEWGSRGTTRASSIRLDRADLVVEGNTGAAVVETIPGALTIAGGGMAQFIHYYNASYKNHTLHVGSLVMEPGAILDIHSPSLVLGATEFEKGNNFVVDAGVTTFGNGATGTVFAAVVPFARASNNNSTADNMFGYLVSYDTVRGFRILDRETEQDAYEAGYVGPVTNQNANVYVSIANEVVEFTGTNVINSLQFTTSAKAGTLRANDGTLTISSGAIEMTGTDNITLNANLIFGAAPAYITYRGDKTGTLKGTFSGSAGVTFQSMAQVSEKSSGITVESTGFYTGPTYINSRLFVATVDFLPHGERLGDVFVNGILQSTSGAITMNGLNGRGSLRHAQSYATTFTMGDNDADGDFTGNIDRANGTVNVAKIGAGTQRLAGHCTHNGATTISGGTLIVDGDFTASPVSVAAGAAIAGDGAITNTLSFAEGAKFAVTVADDAAPCLDVGGLVSGSASVEITTAGKVHDNFASCILRSDMPLGASFSCATKGYHIELRNGGTELWAIKAPSATYIMLQ